MFKKKTPAELDAKARASAAKKGLTLDGSAYVAHFAQADGRSATLAVFPDRVEIHDHGTAGSRGTHGTRVLPRPSITSTAVERAGASTGVVFTVAGSEPVRFAALGPALDGIREALAS